jgi:hypothetical protein
MRIRVFLAAADLDARCTGPRASSPNRSARAPPPSCGGGSDVDLMKVVADGVHEAGGRLCGVSVGFLPVPLTDLVFFAEEPVGAPACLEESQGIG